MRRTVEDEAPLPPCPLRGPVIVTHCIHDRLTSGECADCERISYPKRRRKRAA